MSDMSNHGIEAGTVAMKVATGFSYTGAAGVTYMGFTADEWGVIGIISGIAIGLLTFAGNMAISIYFKAQHLRLAREKLGAPVEG